MNMLELSFGAKSLTLDIAFIVPSENLVRFLKPFNKISVSFQCFNLSNSSEGEVFIWEREAKRKVTNSPFPKKKAQIAKYSKIVTCITVGASKNRPYGDTVGSENAFASPLIPYTTNLLHKSTQSVRVASQRCLRSLPLGITLDCC